ncbi:hypothetical protein MnTg02_00575 [bacterium MnTg02]|nr:hypothetical protein MnTg02_00575 [bacterium MnTg02]
MAHGFRHGVLATGLVKGRLSITPKRHMNMPGLARPVRRPFGHEGRHLVPLLCKDFRERLKERRAIRSFNARPNLNCRLQHAGSGFFVQRFQRKIHGLAQIKEAAIKIRFCRCPDHRIAEITGRHRNHVAVGLVAHRLRCLVEDEKLILEARFHVEAHGFRPV